MGFREYQQKFRSNGSTYLQSGWETPGIKMGFNQGSGIRPGTSTFHNEDELVRIHFNLSGGYDFHYHQLNKTYRLDGRRHNLMYSSGFTMDLQARSAEVETFGIQMEKKTFLSLAEHGHDRLKRVAEAVDLGRSFMALPQWGGEDPHLLGCIYDLRNGKVTGEMKPLWVESKMMEILDRQLNSFLPPSQEIVLSRQEISQMYAARRYLMHHLNQPPTLKAVSQAVGTNEFKLKRNFKSIFGCSVYAFLMQERLKFAAKCLSDSPTPIAQLAYDLGFSSPQHFSRTFRQRFGAPPRTFRRLNARQRKDLIPIV